MKTIVLHTAGGKNHLELRDLPDPGQPGAGEIRVAVHATSLNYHDLELWQGAREGRGDRVPMSDAGGVVEAVGAGVHDFKAGDHVVSLFLPRWQDGTPQAGTNDHAFTPGDGVDGYATEYVVRPVSWFTRAPHGWTHTEAATITTAGLTAWRTLVVDGRLKAGDQVLLLGTGGVSIAALQLAKAMGAGVIITSSSTAKLERARALGADHVINYREVPKWSERVLELTGGRGVDHVVETGGANTLIQSLTAVRVGGHIAVVGYVTGMVLHDLPIWMLLAKQVLVQGVSVGSRRQQQDYVAALEQAGIRPVIDRSFALDRLEDAFALQASGQHFGKLVCEW